MLNQRKFIPYVSASCIRHIAMTVIYVTPLKQTLSVQSALNRTNIAKLGFIPTTQYFLTQEVP